MYYSFPKLPQSAELCLSTISESNHDFNDWFTCLPQSLHSISKEYEDLCKSCFPDGGEIKITRANLRRANIIIFSESPA